MRKLGYLLPLLILLTACGPEKAAPAPPDSIPPEEPAIEAESPSVEEPPGLLFDAEKIQADDAVGGWTVERVAITPHAVGTGYSAEIAFEGSAVVDGTYTRHRGDELLGDLITFRPDQASSEIFPRMSVDDRYIWFAFANQEEAKEMFPAGESGAVTIEISAYTIHFAPSDVYNTATIEAIR